MGAAWWFALLNAVTHQSMRSWGCLMVRVGHSGRSFACCSTWNMNACTAASMCACTNAYQGAKKRRRVTSVTVRLVHGFSSTHLQQVWWQILQLRWKWYIPCLSIRHLRCCLG